MEHTEEMSCSGIHSASMYMLQFPVGYLQMESIEEIGLLDGIKTETKNCCHGWNEHLQTILSLFIF
jgi:hypothetical protein